MVFRLIDTHAHINSKEYQENFDQLLDDLKNNAVEKVVMPAGQLEDCPRIIELIEKYDNLYGAVAVHPSEVQEWDSTSYEKLKDYAVHPKIVAIGETGLDYYWDKTYVGLQKSVFREHIKLALEVNKPIIIHDRDAHADTLSIVKEMNAGKVGGVMHCFSGSAELAIESIKQGFYIALGGTVTFKNARKPKEVAQSIPLDKLLLETDSPYLTPHPFRGQTNSPKYVKLVAEEIARLRGITVEEVAELTSKNAEKLFRI